MTLIRRLVWAQLLTFSVAWALGSGTLLAQKPGDLNGNGTVSWHDFLEMEWTGDIRDGSGTSTPEDGDLDEDRDVDGMDRLRLWELREEGPYCDPLTTTRVKLYYDSATGNVSTDAVGAGCYADMFVLESNEGRFRPQQLIDRVQGYLVWEPQSKYQVSGLSPGTFTHLPTPDRRPPDRASLGRILPPNLSRDEWLAAVDGAWYDTTNSPRFEFQRQWIALPALGDTDRDSDVDSADLLMLLGNWTGAQEPGTAGKIFDEGDFDFDEDVDTADELILLSGWTGAASERFSSADFAGPTNSVLAVPEPSFSCAGVIATLVAIAARRRLWQPKT